MSNLIKLMIRIATALVIVTISSLFAFFNNEDNRTTDNIQNKNLSNVELAILVDTDHINAKSEVNIDDCVLHLLLSELSTKPAYKEILSQNDKSPSRNSIKRISVTNQSISTASFIRFDKLDSNHTYYLYYFIESTINQTKSEISVSKIITKPMKQEVNLMGTQYILFLSIILFVLSLGSLIYIYKPKRYKQKPV